MNCFIEDFILDINYAHLGNENVFCYYARIDFTRRATIKYAKK